MNLITNTFPFGWTSRRCIFALLFIIFIAETGVMFVLPIVVSDHVNPWIEAVLDSTLLTILVAPIVWKFMVRPLYHEIAREQHRSDTILRETADGIIVINERGIIEFFNKVAEDLFGYPGKDMVGQKIDLLMPQPYSDDHDSYIQQYLKTGIKKIINIRREVIGKRKDGTTFPMEIHVSEIVEGDRRIFTGIVKDITERKTTEEAIQQTTEQLARFNRLAVGREKRMIELKQEINDILNTSGKENKYKIHPSADLEWMETSGERGNS